MLKCMNNLVPILMYFHVVLPPNFFNFASHRRNEITVVHSKRRCFKYGIVLIMYVELRPVPKGISMTSSTIFFLNKI